MSANSSEQIDPSPKPSLYIPGTICVEGNIGSGKSTLLAGLKRLGYAVFEEPVESRWAEHLITLYSDPKRWGFTFQIEVVDWYKQLVTDLRKRAREPTPGGGTMLKIVERSPISTYEIFGKNLREMGNFTNWELKLLGKVVESWAWTPEYTFYVKTPYTESYRRLKARGRDGEEKVPLELLRQLELRHEEFAKSKNCGVVYVLDGRQSKEALIEDAIVKLQQINLKCMHNSA